MSGIVPGLVSHQDGDADDAGDEQRKAALAQDTPTEPRDDEPLQGAGQLHERADDLGQHRDRLRHQGWSNVRILKGGLGAWANARLPVESKSHLPSIGIEIYRNLTLGDIERRRYAPGVAIFEEGDDAHGEAYVVHAGTVEIVKRYPGGGRRLNLVKEGELIGQLALFRHAPRSAAAVAVTEVELLVMRSERLEWLIRNRPELTLELLKHLSNQIVSMDPDGGRSGGEPGDL